MIYISLSPISWDERILWEIEKKKTKKEEKFRLCLGFEEYGAEWVFEWSEKVKNLEV